MTAQKSNCPGFQRLWEPEPVSCRRIRAASRQAVLVRLVLVGAAFAIGCSLLTRRPHPRNLTLSMKKTGSYIDRNNLRERSGRVRNRSPSIARPNKPIASSQKTNEQFLTDAELPRSSLSGGSASYPRRHLPLRRAEPANSDSTDLKLIVQLSDHWITG
jgi:hypothetical protein